VGKHVAAPAEWGELLPQDRAILTSILEDAPSDFEAESVLPAMRLLEAAQAFEPAPTP
jgi:hypothetical protein